MGVAMSATCFGFYGFAVFIGMWLTYPPQMRWLMTRGDWLLVGGATAVSCGVGAAAGLLLPEAMNP
jgi:hypothetical protein